MSSAARPQANASPRAPSSSAASTPRARCGSGWPSGCTRSRRAARRRRPACRWGLVDRRDHRAGGRVGLLAGVDGEGLEAGLVPMVLLLAHPATLSRRQATVNRRGTYRPARCWTLWTPSRTEGVHVSIFSRHKTTLPDRRRGAARPRRPPVPRRRPSTSCSTPRWSPTRCPTGYEVAIFGLGCFWGAEEIYWQIPGVWSTSVGYAGGNTAEPVVRGGLPGRTGHTEAVRVVYDPAGRPTPTW